MKIDILTIFPNMFNGFLTESIIKRATEKKQIEINVIDFRQFSPLNNRQVDDTPYGGGAGMVLRCEPIFNCLESIRKDNSHVIILSPEGKKWCQKKAQGMTSYEHLIIICGHYEGFDERIYSWADEVISIGDYVLTGGEIPAMVLVDSITRLIPGVIREDSLVSESFNDDLYDYPTYTKPREYNGIKVPDVLLNGNHKEIENFRKMEQIKKTNRIKSDIINE